MSSARRDADALKGALSAQAETFIGQKTQLNNALLGLGVLTLGAGMSGLHPDSYKVTTGLAGTSYLFGNIGLQPSTLAIYQSGIGAVNCAVAAVKPMQVSDADIRANAEQAKELRGAIPALSKAIAKTRSQLAAADKSVPATMVTNANAAITAAQATEAKARTANANSAELPGAVSRAAMGLKGALSRIHQAVNDAIARGVADSSAVMESLKSLSGIITGFGTNLGVNVAAGAAAGGTNPGAAAAQSLPASDPALAAAAASVQDRLQAALLELSEAEIKVALLAEPMTATLASYRSYDNGAELSKCQLDGAASALTVNRETLTFTASTTDDQSSKFIARGGTKPYKAVFLDSPTFGIEIVNPIGFDTAFEVKVPKTVTAGKELSLLVTDAAAPPNEGAVTVRVSAGTPVSAADATGSDARIAKALQAAVATKTTFSVGTGSDKHDYTVQQAKASGAATTITLQCKASAGSKLDSILAVSTALAAAIQLSGTDTQDFLAKFKANAYVLSAGDGGCMQ